MPCYKVRCSYTVNVAADSMVHARQETAEILAHDTDGVAFHPEELGEWEARQEMICPDCCAGLDIDLACPICKRNPFTLEES